MGYRTEQYTRRGLLAIQPSALFEAFLVMDDPARENTTQGDAVIVDVRGPLEQHLHPWCDSYEAIVQRVRAACSGSARTVVLRFDSPGGDVAGCFDAATEIRGLCAAAGKELVAYVDGDCCSAAYALACAASRICMSTTSLVGSIGVLSCRDDVTAMNAARGLRVEFITSGARKADGHAEAPVTEAELAATQQIVDSMAQLFFDLVASARGIASAQVAQLEARVFHGAAAVAAGLADAVGPLTTALAADAAGGTAQGDGPMASAYEKALAALQEASEGEDANAAAAKKALAALQQAMGGEDDKEGGDDKKKEGGEEPAAAAAPAAQGGEPDGDENKATAAYRLALRAEKRAADLQAELNRRDEMEERRTLIASRELSPEMEALLQKAPIALVRETIASLPAKVVPAAARAATAAPVRGAGQGDGNVSQLPPAEKAALDARMGLTASTPGTRSTDYRLQLGVVTPAPAEGANN